MYNTLKILDLINNETFISDVEKVGDYLRLCTLFTYSDGSNIDVFIKKQNDTVILFDSANLALIFLFSSKHENFIKGLLNSEPFQNLINKYEINMNGLCFQKKVSNIYQISKDIFKFGEFCSITSNLIQSTGILAI